MDEKTMMDGIFHLQAQRNELTSQLEDAEGQIRKLKDALERVRKLIEEHSQDLPPEFAKIVDKHFWDLIGE